MTLQTLGFAAIAVLVLWLDARHRARAAGRRAAAREAAAASTAPSACARCGHFVPAGALACPGCGVPPQIFDVVVASEVPEDGDAPLRALVRNDLCLGCGVCVSVCPEDGAIAMRQKLAVVDAALCVGHGDCAEACPTGAISLAAGAAGHRVVVPSVDADFETNVPGVYIVGELGGRGLIKNAINEGKIAVEAIRRSLADEPAREDASRAVDVAIVGSGPAGLSAGLEALRSGLSYVVLEQGALAETVRNYPRHKILFAEPVSVPLYGDLVVTETSKESLLQVWETIVKDTGLQVRTNQRVDQVERAGWLFRLHAGPAEYLARRVVLAMGRLGSPRRLEVRGEELDKVFYDIVEMEDFRERHVLVVGGGDNAVEAALGLANQTGTSVTLSYRGDRLSRVKERNRAKFERAVDAGRVALLFRSTVREIRRDVVVLNVGGEARILPNDDVIIRIGGAPPSAFLEKLGVRMVQKEIPVESSVDKAG